MGEWWAYLASSLRVYTWRTMFPKTLQLTPTSKMVWKHHTTHVVFKVFYRGPLHWSQVVFCVCPRSFYRVCVHPFHFSRCTIGVILCIPVLVGHREVVIAQPVQVVIGIPPVCVYFCAWHHVLLDKALQGLSVSGFYWVQDNPVGVALNQTNHPHVNSNSCPSVAFCSSP